IVTNLGTGLISGPIFGVDVLNALGTVSNFGTIESTDRAPAYVTYAPSAVVVARFPISAILMNAGGSVYNAPGATIGATFYGVQIAADAGTVANSGTIISTNFGHAAGVNLLSGGLVSNAMNALISTTYIGAWIGSFNAAATANGTVLNQGNIVANDGSGHGAGVWIRAPSAYVLNDTGALIDGGLAGIVFYQQTTIVNRGTISGPSDAIEEGSGVTTAANVSLRLEEAPGAMLVGGVVAPAL